MAKFRALRFVAGLNRVIAWIVLIGGILFGLLMMALTVLAPRLSAGMMPRATERLGLRGFLGGLFVGLLSVLLPALYFVLLQAASDAILMGLSIEENTREIAAQLRGQAAAARPTNWERPPLDE